MEITNKLGLPESIVNVVKYDKHERDGYSVTGLQKSPRQYWLSERHDDEMVEDVSDRIWAILGSAVHYIIAKGEGKNQLVEEKLETEINGIKLSGRLDCYDNKTITDWKTTSVWSVIYGSSDDNNEKQLNCYAYLLRVNGFEVDKIQNIFILRDWQKSKAKYDKAYPQNNVAVNPVKLWTVEKQREYIESRLSELESFRDIEDDKLPECSNDDKWHKPDLWKVKKTGGKKALKNHEDESEANEHLKRMGAGYEIEHVVGKNTKCLDYCNGRLFCQYRGEDE